jgi:hypothetical protein
VDGYAAGAAFSGFYSAPAVRSPANTFTRQINNFKKMTEEKQRCQFEIFVEKYFGLAAETTTEDTNVFVSNFGELVNLLAMYSVRDYVPGTIPETLDHCFAAMLPTLPNGPQWPEPGYGLYVSAYKISLANIGHQVDYGDFIAGYQWLNGRDRYHEFYAFGSTPLEAMQNLYKKYPNVRRS